VADGSERKWVVGRFLSSRVARRIFFLMLLSALVPILSFALLSFQQVTRQLESDAAARLQQDSKQLGMAVLERLLLLEATLGLYEPSGDAADLPAFFRERFRSIEVRDTARLDAGDEAHLAAGGSLLRVSARRGPVVTLLRRHGERVLVAEIEPRFLFVPEALRTNVDLRVHAEGRPVFSAIAAAPHEEKQIGPWDLFLRPQFRGATWTIELAEPRATFLAPLRQFQTVFPLVTLLSLLAVCLATLVLVRRSLVPIEHLQTATRRLAARDFSTRVGSEIQTDDEFGELAHSFDAMAANIEHHVSVVETVSSVGRVLSVEQDSERLLATILRGTMSVTDARAGALSLCDAQENLVRHLLLEWDASDADDRPRRLQSVAEDTALAGRTLHEPARGELSIPMRNHEGHVIGVVQLLRPGGFSAESLALAESLASQTAVALTKHRLAGEFRALFEGLIQLIVKAIDQKSPYTGEHCRRVPILTEMIADAACETTEGALKQFTLSEAERYELRIAALLHDCGKVTTPVHVQDKSSKLQTLYDRIELVDARFEIARRELELAALRRRLPDAPEENAALAAELRALEDDRAFLRTANVGGEFMPPEAQQRVQAIAARWHIHAPSGETEPILSADEVENLCVSRGTLNEREREIINHHVVASIEMLEQLPYPRSLRNVPAIAGAHHERMDGQGYPQGLQRDQISMQGRILGLADVFEALTARDRPYKPGMTLGRALSILESMRDEGHIDGDLFEMFVRDKVYLRYAAEYLDPEQIDEELIDEITRSMLTARRLRG
jgi:HD-GYP domain-containing protein (c-di-GMP phosphodiesterase class II)/HAMP domain-containing protein